MSWNLGVWGTGACLCALVLIGCSNQEAGQERANRMQWGGGAPAGEQEKALSVRAEVVERQPISTYIIANTTLEAIRDVTVYAKLNAIVSRLQVEEGAHVREGDPLAFLDDREIRNEVEQAQIAVAQAEVAVQQSEVKAQLSAASYERATSLFQQKLTSREEYDQAALQARTDNLALDNAKQQLAAAAARLSAAEIQLGYTTIAAPISGVVTQRLVDVGDRVNVNEALFVLQDFPPLWARIHVPERSLPQLRVGQTAELKLETFPDRDFSGQIKMVSPTVDSSSGTVKVTIELSRPGGLLRPGMFGTVYIATETHPDAVVVPKKSILRERDLNFVFVVNNDGRVSRREVGIGFAEENRVEILSGVDAGETIVTVGVETLNDGYPVQVQNRDGSVATGTVLASNRPDSGPGDGSAGSEARPSGGLVQQPPSPNAAQSPEPAQERRGWGGPGGGAGPGGGNRSAMFERLMSDPEVRKRYEAKLQEDPELATDPEKRRAFFRELMTEMRAGSEQQ